MFFYTANVLFLSAKRVQRVRRADCVQRAERAQLAEGAFVARQKMGQGVVVFFSHRFGAAAKEIDDVVIGVVLQAHQQRVALDTIVILAFLEESHGELADEELDDVSGALCVYSVVKSESVAIVQIILQFRIKQYIRIEV